MPLTLTISDQGLNEIALALRSRRDVTEEIIEESAPCKPDWETLHRTRETIAGLLELIDNPKR